MQTIEYGTPELFHNQRECGENWSPYGYPDKRDARHTLLAALEFTLSTGVSVTTRRREAAEIRSQHAQGTFT